jgi:hypothetical protein
LRSYRVQVCIERQWCTTADRPHRARVARKIAKDRMADSVREGGKTRYRAVVVETKIVKILK